MNQLDLFPILPELSDEAALALSELLHELALAFESHYAAQIRRHLLEHSPPANVPPEPDWDKDGTPF
jgi:hypothetical protein